MLHERITVLLQYVIGVVNSMSSLFIPLAIVARSLFAEQARPDHSILRQISSIVAGLPSMDAPQFQQELMTVRSSSYVTRMWLTQQEYSDVQLTNYLTTLTKQLDALNDVSKPSHS
jgi:COP9 signalosome complex subunit 6